MEFFRELMGKNASISKSNKQGFIAILIFFSYPIAIVIIGVIVSFIEKLKGSLGSDDEDINNGENTLHEG
jgi:hypothetical protein